MKISSLFFFILILACAPIYAKDTQRLEVVREFIQEICEAQGMRDIAESDMTESSKAQGDEKMQKIMSDVVRNGTRAKNKLTVRVYALKGMKLSKPFDNLIPYLIRFNERKIKLWDELTQVAKIFISNSPRQSVDYNKIASRMPEITAEMEFADESIFKVTPMIFALLIDQHPNSQNQLNRLIITKRQGDELIASIDNSFGDKIKDKNTNWTVSAATVMRSYISEKGYRYSDDPAD